MVLSDSDRIVEGRTDECSHAFDFALMYTDDSFVLKANQSIISTGLCSSL
jgi:hypothetical protein